MGREPRDVVGRPRFWGHLPSMAIFQFVGREPSYVVMEFRLQLALSLQPKKHQHVESVAGDGFYIHISQAISLSRPFQKAIEAKDWGKNIQRIMIKRRTCLRELVLLDDKCGTCGYKTSMGNAVKCRPTEEWLLGRSTLQRVMYRFQPSVLPDVFRGTRTQPKNERL